MDKVEFPTTAGEIAAFLDATCLGDATEKVENLSSVQSSVKSTLSYFSDKKYSAQLRKLSGGVILTTQELADVALPLTYIVVSDPKKSFARIASAFVPKSPWKGISPKAEIHPTAVVHPSAHIGPYAIICEGVNIGAHTVIYPHAYIGPGVQVGAHCEIQSHVSLLFLVRLADRVRIFAGSVLGSEGFGFLEGGGSFTEMPQLGWVVVEEDVRIGAKCTVDRSTLGETRIGAGTKIDDQVHIGHNCVIGKNCILCAQVGLAGSTVLEDNVMLGGQVGLAGHLTVGKGARLAGQSGASTNLKGGETYLSSPAMPIREAINSFKHLRKLSDLVQRVRKLEEGMNGKT